MTFRVFMETIKSVCDISGSLAEIGVDLCEAAGASGVTPVTVHSWIYVKDKHGKEKKPDGKRYFKNEIRPGYREVDWAGFIQFFKKIQPPVWMRLRDAFNNNEMNNNGIILCNTENEDEFYWSLLEQFCKLLRVKTPTKPASLRHILPERQVVFGRETKLRDICKIFESSNYAALTGIGGIGKSYVALAYAYKLIKSGDYVIQYVKCEDNDTLHDAVLRLEFDRLRKDKKVYEFDRRIDMLKNSQQPTLIVFDNLNKRIIPREQNNLKKLTGCGQHIKFLITSWDAAVLGGDKQHEVKIEPLSMDKLLELYTYHRFSDNSDHSRYIDERKETLSEIFKKVYYHTLVIVLLAKLARNSHMDEEEINQRLIEGFDVSSEMVNIKKDDDFIEGTVRDIIKKIFVASNLIGAQRDIMRHMALLPLSGMDSQLFKELTGYKADNDIIHLRDNNWVIMDEESHRISLHPLISDILFDMDDTKPLIELCSKFLNNLSAKYKESTPNSRVWHDTRKTLIRYKLKVNNPLINNNPLFQNLKDEYINPILFLQKLQSKHAENEDGISLKEFISNDEED